MPIRIRPECKHCGQAIHQDDYFGPWIHDQESTVRIEHSRSGKEFRYIPAFDHEAMPRIDVVKIGEQP